MNALAAIETAIVCIREDRPVPTDLLIVICQAAGEPSEFLSRRRRSAFAAHKRSNYQTVLALVSLETLAKRLREREGI